MPITIRTALHSEHEAADRVARIAFREYEAEFPDWIPLLRDGRPMARLAAEGELLVADGDGAIVGAVGYLPPGRSKEAVFRPEWAVLRMMAVDPAHRGHGIARALATECARRARRDNAASLALYTSPAMKTAVELYLRMGFRQRNAIGHVIGMPAVVFELPLR
jgi:GNAT superfamily N-acetyltransferase